VAAFTGQPDLYLEAKPAQTVAYQIPAYNNPVSYGWSGNSDGLVLNPVTGQVNGTPNATGTYTMNVTVTGSTVGLPAGQQNVIKYVLEIDVH